MRIVSGLVDESDFDEERRGMTAREVLNEIKVAAHFEEDLVVTHGDYCMPNVLFGEDLDLSGFIDVGRSGVADWHSDLALATRSIVQNLGRPFVEPFHRRYGKRPDINRINFYLMLDDLF